jgi:hypothetical protein
MADAALLELRRLVAAVAELRDEQAHLLRALLARDDRRTGAALLPLIAELLDGRAFTAAELLTAALDDRTPAGRALCELVAEFVTDTGGMRALGRLLARLEGVPLAGCRLVSAGAAGGVCRWRVKVVSGD